MRQFEKEYREAMPQTIGETDRQFDDHNYTEFLERWIVKLFATPTGKLVSHVANFLITKIIKKMTETLIAFETAKLAKEKGFDEKCSHYYVLDFQNFKADGILHKCGLPDDWDNPNILQFVKRTGQPHLANAPTQSLLQKWLREKHHIQINIFAEWSKKKKKVTFCHYIISLKGIMANLTMTAIMEGLHYVMSEFETYEDALESGLQKSLNFIKT